MRRTLILIAGLLFSVQAQAHGLAPMLLRIDESSNHQLIVALKASANLESPAIPRFPAHCESQHPARKQFEGDATWIHWTLDCSHSGGIISVPGLGDYNVVVDYRNAYGQSRTALLSRVEPHFQLDKASGYINSITKAIKSGAIHLFIGLDHLLFVAGLTLLLRVCLRHLVIAISTFTAGHSVTLAFASLGWLTIPQALAEIAIATSLLILGLQILSPASESNDLKCIALLPFGFGLVHGLGFAGAMSAAGLTGLNLGVMLLGFNLGIELGQLLCVVIVLALLGLSQKQMPKVETGTAYLIGSCAVFWLWERLISITV